MSKDKTPQAPDSSVTSPKPTNSEYYQDGQLMGKTTMSGGVTKQESFMTPFEKQQKDYAQSQLPVYQQKMLNPDQASKDSWQSQAQATKNNQMKAFNVDSTKSDNDLLQFLSGRGAFGGHSAGSSQVDHFASELEKNKLNQLDSINNDFTANMQNYETNDFNKNQNIYNMLNGGLGQQIVNNQNNSAQSLQGFNTGNNLNQQNAQNELNSYAQRVSMYNADKALKAQQMAAMMAAASSGGG